MKKPLKITLIVLSVLLVLVIGVSAVLVRTVRTGQLGENVYFLLNTRSDTVVIYGSGEMWHYSYNPFDVYDPDPRSSLSDLTYQYADEVKTVIILDGVTNIPFSLFFDCKDLEMVYIPELVTEIWFSSFAACQSLCSVHFEADAPQFMFPPSVEDVGQNVFWPQYLFKKDFPTIYYQEGTSGWDSERWEYFPPVEQAYSIPWLAILFGRA